jgi:hypothetical protein
MMNAKNAQKCQGFSTYHRKMDNLARLWRRGTIDLHHSFVGDMCSSPGIHGIHHLTFGIWHLRAKPALSLCG